MDIIYFSPTGTTRAVVEAIAQGMDAGQSTVVDLTLPRTTYPSSTSEAAIIGVPVYSGRVPELAATRLREHVRGLGRPAVLVVVYGNRAYEDALLELQTIAEELGFIPVAGAAFVGEHSFSTPGCPVAEGRPDATDKQLALEFGRSVSAKLTQAKDDLPKSRLQVPGNFPYRDGVQAVAISPDTLGDNCVLCGECEHICPTGAITLTSESVETDKTLCLRCCACTRICRYAARVMLHPKIQEFGKILNEKFARRAEPEMFL